jgi:hypothetical protein
MKLHTLALASTVVCSTAFAAPAVDVDNAATVKIVMTGATALRATIAGLMLNDICGGSVANATTTLYNVAESGTGFSFNGNFWAITCRVTAAGGAKVGLAANTPVAFFKSDSGGSAQGVFPVYFDVARPMVEPKPSACTTTTTPDRVYTGCASSRSEKPNFGVSDVEPGLFRGANVPNNDPLDTEDDQYPDSGLSLSQIGQMTVTPVVQTVFAVAVNNGLYDAMFAKQGLGAKFSSTGVACTTSSTDENCVPSIGRAEARSFFQGTEANWRMLVPAADTKIDTQVNICRRVNGSGTQAAANVHLLEFPCNASALSPADWTASSSAAPEAVSASKSTTESGLTMQQYINANMGGAGGTMPKGEGGEPVPLFVFEGPGTGDVVRCLNTANTNAGYAIGHVSRENVPGASDRWKHVRLEGAQPSRDNAKAGRYDYFVESTIQYLNSAFSASTPQQQSFVTGFIAQARKPDALARLSPANQQGVAALPDSFAGAFGTGTANEIAFGSRVTRAGNSCNPLTAVK